MRRYKRRNRKTGTARSKSKLYAKIPGAIKRRFKRFWKINGIPSITTLPGNLPGNTGIDWLVGMGHTEVVLLSSGDKGQGGQKRKIKGKWFVASDGSGKHVVLLTKRPIQGKLKLVGYAHETHYSPSDDIEKAGTHKAGTYWRHIHGVDDEKKGVPKSKLRWPAVYADRNGKVDSKSNFIYGKTPLGKITDWMYG